MIKVSECVICGAAVSAGKRAMVAPFLARRIWQRETFPVELSHCANCDFEFYNPRLELTEEMKLYHDYRESEYQKSRQETEPWYSEAFNKGLADEKRWTGRTGALGPVVKQALTGRKVASVLDFGGDRGELVDKLFPDAERFVYDISGVEPVAGVTALRSEEECKQRGFDVIVTSNLLEHVGFPLELMARINAIAAPNTLVLHDVPLESSLSAPMVARRVVQFGVLGVTRPKVAKSLMHGGWLRVMHEHVNYFSLKALNEMMRRAGWNVLSSGIYRIGAAPLGQPMLWNLSERAAV
ncbi:class I SAM-dependent methyltransferase [Candidatus Korobacter versatilis]|nr:class I SAM-dependent methyltransferase [Candidatus Koribacter versatilis]